MTSLTFRENVAAGSNAVLDVGQDNARSTWRTNSGEGGPSPRNRSLPFALSRTWHRSFSRPADMLSRRRNVVRALHPRAATAD
jgi:hypothetical protein